MKFYGLRQKREIESSFWKTEFERTKIILSLGVNDSQSSAGRNGTPRIFVRIHREGVFGWCLHAGVQERGRGRVAACQDFPFLHAGTIIMIVNFARSETRTRVLLVETRSKQRRLHCYTPVVPL